jgi:hypothetical protein
MTPFLQFKTGCFGDDQRTLDRLQVICGRLFLFAEPNPHRQIVLHHGTGHGKSMLLAALGKIFPAIPVNGSAPKIKWEALEHRERAARLAVWDGTAEHLLATPWLKDMASNSAMQTHVVCSEPYSEPVGGGWSRRLCQIHWQRRVSTEDQNGVLAHELPQDPDFLAWLVEGTRRAIAADPA